MNEQTDTKDAPLDTRDAPLSAEGRTPNGTPASQAPARTDATTLADQQRST